MSKHTPGPWEILNTLEICAGNKDICEMKNWMDEDQANARLIAAAPELLEALESMLQSFLITQLLYDYPIDAPCNKARAAIAKAKGEV